MVHPLDGARLKVIRAQKHLESFNEVASQYIDTQPHQVISKFEGDHVRIGSSITAEPPPGLACIVGDFVTNLRASIDYIAWELALRGGRHLTDRQKRRIAFPIAHEKAEFAKSDCVKNLLGACGVPASAIDIIESVQPYQAGYEPMASLDLLVRIDKHRTLLLCRSFMQSMGDASVYAGDNLRWHFSGFSRVEMNLAAFDPSLDPATDYGVQMNGKPTIYISLKDFPSPGETRNVELFAQILKCVADVVARFEPEFG